MGGCAHAQVDARYLFAISIASDQHDRQAIVDGEASAYLSEILRRVAARGSGRTRMDQDPGLLQIETIPFEERPSLKTCRGRNA